MRREFIITRILLVLGALAYGLAFFLVEPDPAPGSREPAQVQESPRPHDSSTLSWEEQLSSPEIQSFWQERRLILDHLSHAYLDEPDSSRRQALRQELERLIQESADEITALRHQQLGGMP